MSEVSRASLISWLQPESVAEDLSGLLEQRHRGTCRWIFDTDEFKGWHSSLLPTLWIRGKPGSGKSMLAATLIEQLQAENTVTAYFFCRLGDDSRRSFESILQTWLWQILEQMPELTRTALRHHSGGPGIRGQLAPVKNALKEIFSQSSKTIFLIVDGLDECESGATSAEKLVNFVSTLGEKSQLAVISRPENWIRKAFDSTMQDNYCTVQVTTSATETDLGRWIQDCITSMELSDTELEQLALTKLQKDADGMFLWTRFQLETLKAQFAVEDAIAVLQNELPKDLEATYERLLKNVQEIPNPVPRERAYRILQWITAANRPLTLVELDFALGIQIDSKISPKQRSLLRGASTVIEACGSFVEVAKGGQIRFVHASAKEFLISRGVHFGLRQPDPRKSIQKALDSMHIARACLTCLSFSDINVVSMQPSDRSEMEQLRNFVEKHPFFGYAALNWWKHLNDIPFEDERLLQNTIAHFLESSENVLRWLQLYQYLILFHPLEGNFSHPNTASCWRYIEKFWNAHLGPNAANLFDRWQRWHIEMGFNRYALLPRIHIAAFFNFPDMIECELQRGISVDFRNGYRFTPLLQAAHGDSPDAALTLIEHGADVNARTTFDYTPVRYASRNGLSTLPILLAAGSPSHCRDNGSGVTALYEAVSSLLYHPHIFNTLLNVPNISEFIKVKDFKGCTPMDCATAIDVNASALLLYRRSFLGFNTFNVLYGTQNDDASKSIRNFFTAEGRDAFRVLHQGWADLGVHTPMDSTYESVLCAVTEWKVQVIRRLAEKEADASSRDEKW